MPTIAEVLKKCDAVAAKADAGMPLSQREYKFLLAQVNTMLRLKDKPEIKAGTHSREELESLYRKLSK